MTSEQPDGVGAAIGDKMKQALLWAAGEPTDTADEHDELQDRAIEEAAADRQ